MPIKQKIKNRQEEVYKKNVNRIRSSKQKSDTREESLSSGGNKDLKQTKMDIDDAIKKIDDYMNPKSKGKGLKIMMSNQLITRLPILLAQKKAGHNSQKLNNEIRQIIYSLYQSKNMSKAVYNHLMNIL